MTPRITRVTEEVARWAFEVHIVTRTDWCIAFTNPTAGPWKRMMATNVTGEIGEVLRFDRNTTRPDIILFNDTLRTVLIVEAKTDLHDLLIANQVDKTGRLVGEMATTLGGKAANPYWAGRSQYSVICGLLWGAEETTPTESIDSLCQAYSTALPATGVLPVILTVECIRTRGMDGITCYGTLVRWSHSPGPADDLEARLLTSLAFG